MRDTDHRGVGDRFMPYRDILDLDRTDPFAARLHDILRAVGDLHIAFGVDRADVAGVEKTFLVEHVAALAAIIGARVRSSDEHTSELQLLMRTSYAVFTLTQ